MAAQAYQRDGKLSGIATGLQRSRQQDGRPAGVRPDHRRRPPRHGQDRARHQHRLQHRQGAGAARCSPTATSTPSMAASSASSRSKCRPSSSPPVFSPSRPAFRRARSAAAASTSSDFEKIRDVAIELQHLPFFVDETGGLSIAQLAARARRLKRQKGLDLLVIDYIQLLSGSSKPLAGQPRAGDHRDHHQPQGAGQGTATCRSSRCRSCRVRSKTATTSGRSSRTCVNPARSSRTPTW